MLDFYRIHDNEIVPYEEGAIDIGAISDECQWFKNKIGELELDQYELLENILDSFDAENCTINFFEDCRLDSNSSYKLLIYINQYLKGKSELDDNQINALENIINILSKAVNIGYGVITICD